MSMCAQARRKERVSQLTEREEPHLAARGTLAVIWMVMLIKAWLSGLL